MTAKEMLEWEEEGKHFRIPQLAILIEIHRRSGSMVSCRGGNATLARGGGGETCRVDA